MDADDFARVIRCTLCTTATDAALARTERDVPQPGFVGVNYAAHRVLLVGQNPGQPKTSRLRDEPYMEALRELGRTPSPATHAHYATTVRAYAEHWPITRAHFPLARCGLTLDDIAYCNIVRCRTVADAAPGPRVMGTCVVTHFEHWLGRLAPRLVVFIGRWAADRGAAACVRNDIEFVWLSRQRNLPTEAREAGIADVVGAVRRAAGIRDA